MPLTSRASLCGEAPVNFERAKAAGQHWILAPSRQFVSENTGGNGCRCRSGNRQHSRVYPAWRTVAEGNQR